MIADLGAMSELDDLSEGNSSVGTKESDSESTKSSSWERRLTSSKNKINVIQS